MKCPGCQGDLTKKTGLSESVWECSICRDRWLIIKTSSGQNRKEQ